MSRISGTCARPNCDRRITNVKWCGVHYEMERRSGRSGYLDAEPVLQHLLALRAIGWEWARIAEASGVTRGAIQKIRRRDCLRVRARTANAVLALPLEPQPARHRTSPVGTMRRLEAMMWMGWRRSDIAAEIGVSIAALNMAFHRGAASHGLALAVARAYERMSIERGPSEWVSSLAKSKGYAPPAAWDDIDDPNEQPKAEVTFDVVDPIAVERVVMGKATGETLTDLERAHAARLMAAKGATKQALIERLRASRHTIDRWLAAA